MKTKKNKAVVEHISLTLIDQPAKTPLPPNIRQYNYDQYSPLQLTDALISHYSTPAKFGFCNWPPELVFYIFSPGLTEHCFLFPPAQCHPQSLFPCFLIFHSANLFTSTQWCLNLLHVFRFFVEAFSVPCSISLLSMIREAFSMILARLSMILEARFLAAAVRR